MSSSALLDAKLRSFLYWSVDGISALVGGICCLLLGSGLFLSQRDPHTTSQIALAALCFVVSLAIAFGRLRIIEWLKSRITYPRTGYVRPPENQGHPLALTAALDFGDTVPPEESKRVRKEQNRLALLTAVLFVVPVGVMPYVHSRWICLLAGLGAPAAILIAGRYLPRLPWVLLSGFPLLGLYMTSLQPQFVGLQRFAFFFAGSGLLLVLHGVFSLFRYLRRNPRSNSLESAG